MIGDSSISMSKKSEKGSSLLSTGKKKVKLEMSGEHFKLYSSGYSRSERLGVRPKCNIPKRAVGDARSYRCGSNHA